MNTAMIVMVAIFAISGCAVSPYEKCGVNAADRTVLLNEWPDSRLQLIAMLDQRIAAQSELDLAELDQREVWFRTTNGSLVFCRYLDRRNACGVDGYLAIFEKEGEAWQTDGAAVLICMRE